MRKWEPLDMSESWSRFLVALTPAQVADAAEKALRGMETAKPSNGGEE